MKESDNGTTKTRGVRVIKGGGKERRPPAKPPALKLLLDQKAAIGRSIAALKRQIRADRGNKDYGTMG